MLNPNFCSTNSVFTSDIGLFLLFVTSRIRILHADPNSGGFPIMRIRIRNTELFPTLACAVSSDTALRHWGGKLTRSGFSRLAISPGLAALKFKFCA